MASPRRIHIRRFADMTMGSWLNGAKTMVQKLAWKKAIDVSKGQSSFNETIRNNSPTLYLVDPALIAQTVIEEFSNKDSKFIIGVFTDTGLVSSSNKEYEDVHNTSAKNLSSKFFDLEMGIRNAIVEEFKHTTVKELQDIINNIYNKLISDMTLAEKNKKSYIFYQIAASKAGSELRRQLNTLGISILIDANLMLDNLDRRIAFVGYRFTGAVSTINAIIQKVVKKEVSKIFSVSDKFAIGNLVHAGHVGIYEDKTLLGINMPGALIGGLASNKFAEIEKAVGNLELHVKQGIKLNTNYVASSGAFLDLQFNFAVSMTSTLNSTILSPQEVEAIKSIAGNITDELLESVIKKQITDSSMLSMSTDLSASPTITEFIIDSVINTIKGKKTTSIKHSVNSTLDKNLIASNTTISKKSSTNKLKVPNKVKITVKNNLSTPSMSNLQALIQARLAEQVKRNMGTGYDKKVLNFRSGRLAESARVERISQSRAGMVSAFYSYMRNPYGTFSEGGKQQYPRSRDPKALISKSIREIGATMVGNRMRAVLL